MSNFMKKGKRSSINTINKKRIAAVTEILEELDKIATKLIQWSFTNKQTIDKDKIKELAETMTDMPIGDLEVSLLWAKLNDFQNKMNEYRKSQKEGSNI